MNRIFKVVLWVLLILFVFVLIGYILFNNNLVYDENGLSVVEWVQFTNIEIVRCIIK